MKGSFRTALVAALVSAFVAAGAAVATTQAFTLGATNRVNAASKVTNLQSNGSTVSPVDAPLLTFENRSTTAHATPLALIAGAGRPALSVNTGAKVTNLNADKLDGLDSTAFVPSSAALRFKTISADADTTFSAHAHALGTVDAVQIDGFCIDDGTSQVLEIALYPTVGHLAFAAVSQSDVSGYSPETDAYANASWTLARADAAHGTPLFRTTTGTVLLPDNHSISFNLFMGQNIRGQTTGKCFWGGSAIFS